MIMIMLNQAEAYGGGLTTADDGKFIVWQSDPGRALGIGETEDNAVGMARIMFGADVDLSDCEIGQLKIVQD